MKWLAPVMEQPGRWARIKQYPTANTASSIASKLRRPNAPLKAPPGRWEFRYDNDGWVYAKYLGPEKKER